MTSKGVILTVTFSLVPRTGASPGPASLPFCSFPLPKVPHPPSYFHSFLGLSFSGVPRPLSDQADAHPHFAATASGPPFRCLALVTIRSPQVSHSRPRFAAGGGVWAERGGLGPRQGLTAAGPSAGLLSVLYLPTGFFSLAREGCPSLSTELLLLLQPLSVLTFHLDLLFEHHHLPLRHPQPPAAPRSPPALQQTVQALLHWGGRLAQSLRGASGENPPSPSAPSAPQTAGSWWEQLTQASRVYASGGAEGFSIPRWGARGQGSAAGGTQESSLPTEDSAPGRGAWLGRLFGVPGGLAETESGALKSR